MVRVIFQKDGDESIKILSENGYRLTKVDAHGVFQPVKMIFSTIKRSEMKKFVDLLLINNPTAFYTIEDVKQVKEGYLTKRKRILNPAN